MDTNLCANQAYSQGGPERLFVERPLPCGTWSHTHLDAHTLIYLGVCLVLADQHMSHIKYSAKIDGTMVEAPVKLRTGDLEHWLARCKTLHHRL